MQRSPTKSYAGPASPGPRGALRVADRSAALAGQAAAHLGGSRRAASPVRRGFHDAVAAADASVKAPRGAAGAAAAGAAGHRARQGVRARAHLAPVCRASRSRPGAPARSCRILNPRCTFHMTGVLGHATPRLARWRWSGACQRPASSCARTCSSRAPPPAPLLRLKRLYESQDVVELLRSVGVTDAAYVGGAAAAEPVTRAAAAGEKSFAELLPLEAFDDTEFEIREPQARAFALYRARARAFAPPAHTATAALDRGWPQRRWPCAHRRTSAGPACGGRAVAGLHCDRVRRTRPAVPGGVVCGHVVAGAALGAVLQGVRAAWRGIALRWATHWPRLQAEDPFSFARRVAAAFQVRSRTARCAPDACQHCRRCVHRCRLDAMRRPLCATTCTWTACLPTRLCSQTRSRCGARPRCHTTAGLTAYCRSTASRRWR